MLYLMMLFAALFIFHFIRSDKFEKEHPDLPENKKKTGPNQIESEIIL